MVAIVVGVVLAAIVYWSGGSPTIYAMGVLGAGAPVAGGGRRCVAADHQRNRQRPPSDRRAVVITAIACATLLIEFPFASPSYLFYTIPLSMVALAAVVGTAGRTAASVQLVVVIFLLLFGIVRVNPGTHKSFGFRFIETDETVRMKLERSSLRVRAADAARYEGIDRGRASPRERSHALGRSGRAGGVFSERRAQPNPDPVRLPGCHGGNCSADRTRSRGAGLLVVLNLQPDFSEPPDQATVDALRGEFRMPGACLIGVLAMIRRATDRLLELPLVYRTWQAPFASAAETILEISRPQTRAGVLTLAAARAPTRGYSRVATMLGSTSTLNTFARRPHAIRVAGWLAM